MSDPARDIVRSAALWFEPEADGIEAVLDRVGDARLVLIGESTHGTEEFHRLRAQITQALILEKGFNIVAIEADWRDAYRVNRYVRGRSDDGTAEDALDDFKRFPRWMWRNTEVARFVDWLRDVNGKRAPKQQAGFYGLDLYSLHASMHAVLQYLEDADPEAAERARLRYRCFEGFGEDAQSYAYTATLGLTPAGENEAVEQLAELRRQAARYAGRDRLIPGDEPFMAEQHARLARHADQYYRAMFGARQHAWNLRDTHMADTLDALMAHVAQTSGGAKTVVWAHNSHLGDARATEMGQHGEINLGQLARERYQKDVRLIGLTTHAGSVTAASDWDEPTHHMRVQPSLPASYEALFHTVGLERFMLTFEDEDVCEALTVPRLERSIGVVYRPERERVSHYFVAQLCKQFDAVLHIDRTHALEPLDMWANIAPAVDLAETYPTSV